MFKFNIILLTIILLSLQIVLIILIVKYLNIMEEIRRIHLLLHEDLLEIALNLKRDRNERMLKEFKVENKNKLERNNSTITELKSSTVSKEELEKLMEGKELAFKKEINVSPGEMFVNNDIGWPNFFIYEKNHCLYIKRKREYNVCEDAPCDCGCKGSPSPSSI